MYGFCGRLLHLDLDSGRSTYRDLDESRLRQYFGGIGLGTSLLYEFAPACVEPLSPANPLISAVRPRGRRPRRDPCVRAARRAR